MKTANKILIGVGVIALILGILIGTNISKPSVSGRYSTTEQSFIQGLKVGLTDQFSVSNAGVLSTSGSISTTGNIAGATETLTGILTLSKSAGCFNMYATSSATVTKIEFYATTTGAGIGTLKVSYGSCS